MFDPLPTGVQKPFGGQTSICTTPWQQSDAAELHAHQVAKLFDVPYVARNARSIERLLMDEQVQAVIVADHPVRIYHVEQPGTPLFFHPSMASQRILRMQRGEADRLIQLCRLQMGDHVVDATLGLGTDSLVFAAVVGATGRVIGLEGAETLYRLFRSAQEFSGPVYPDVAPYLQRIEPVLTNHRVWLAQQADNSVDGVYFDPMFTRPATDSASIEPLRAFADHSVLSLDTWHEAQRVARRCVVCKERNGSPLFETLQITPDKRRGKIAYGVWHKR